MSGEDRDWFDYVLNEHPVSLVMILLILLLSAIRVVVAPARVERKP